MLIEQIENQPDQIAVISDKEYLTYSEVGEKSKSIALYLQAFELSNEKCIGIYLDSSIDLIISVWGIILSGNAYLPLSTEYPENRLKFMIENGDLEYIITNLEFKAQLKKLIPKGIVIITTEDINKFWNGKKKSLSKLIDRLESDSLAYVIYTSGSTGNPKGVMIEHGSIVSQMRWLSSTYFINSTKTILQKTPISFDAAQWEILALACGSKIVVGGLDISRDPEKIISLIKSHEITSLQCVPTLLQALLQSVKFGDCKSLEQVFSGGEALSRKLAIQFFEKLPNTTLINLYGPTECSINSSSYVVDPTNLESLPKMIPIGFPVDETDFFILNDNLEKVEAEEVGDLFIGGIQLARGYMKRMDLTKEAFLNLPLGINSSSIRLYKTGDRALWNSDGSVQFKGRTDNQVKIRGYRVELDEIKVAIENHNWVKHSAVIVEDNKVSGTQSLLAFVELDSREATVMDQGNHGSHHQNKRNKLQLKAQLANLGCKNIDVASKNLIIELPFKKPQKEHLDLAFSRKTYRFYNGGEAKSDHILELLNSRLEQKKSKSLDCIDLKVLGDLLRYFGQFTSEERLLPKYTYASPGALYATQIYLELVNIHSIECGIYYYHPIHHQLVLIHSKKHSKKTKVKLHFVGKRAAIEPVYKNNIEEVLEMEVGHILGVFEKLLPEFGFGIDAGKFTPSVKSKLQCSEQDMYLGTFQLTSDAENLVDDAVELYVHSHNNSIEDLPMGTYKIKSGKLIRLSEDIIRKKDVIAINQEVYQRAKFGVSIVSKSKDEWKNFIVLGKKLQHLQMNILSFGLMPSGYSSKSKKDLPSAKRLKFILDKVGIRSSHSYYCLGGLVSDDQIKSKGMNEDIVHMKGPAEMLKDDLSNHLPIYMIPNSIIVIDQMPITPNQKIDYNAVKKIGERHFKFLNNKVIPPRTEIEIRIAKIWKRILKVEKVSVIADFFELGGNSLIAVPLLNKINSEFECKLLMQVLFEHSTIEKLAKQVLLKDSQKKSRIVTLQNEGKETPIFCWSGLGGFTMNLKDLANKVGTNHPFFGVQSLGINKGEIPCGSITEMASADMKEILEKQDEGPYSLWGFSFGARVAFETCYQLEQRGEIVKNLVLIAPGSPKIWNENEAPDCNNPEFSNKAFVTILFSVFAGSIDDARLISCLKSTVDEKSFSEFIFNTFSHLDMELIGRVISIVKLTYEFKYNFKELLERKIKAPITIFKAKGDDYSFLETVHGYSSNLPTIVNLRGNHYQILKEPFIDELVEMLSWIVDQNISNYKTKENGKMPHIDIKHFPANLDEKSKTEFIESITEAVKKALGAKDDAISITMESIDSSDWDNRVYNPEIVQREKWLVKRPGYGSLTQ